MANAKATTTKSNTAMVHNPARKLTVGGASRTANPVRKTKKRRSNPAPKKVVNASSHRRRRPRRSNPANFQGLIMATLMVGLGVSIFDFLSTRFLPQNNLWLRVGAKGTAAWVLQSSVGNKIPFLGRYKNELALVFGVAAVVDLVQAYVMPGVNDFANGLLGAGKSAINMIPAGGELGDDYYVMEELDNEDDYDE